MSMSKRSTPPTEDIPLQKHFKAELCIVNEETYEHESVHKKLSLEYAMGVNSTLMYMKSHNYPLDSLIKNRDITIDYLVLFDKKSRQDAIDTYENMLMEHLDSTDLSKDLIKKTVGLLPRNKVSEIIQKLPNDHPNVRMIKASLTMEQQIYLAEIAYSEEDFSTFEELTWYLDGSKVFMAMDPLYVGEQHVKNIANYERMFNAMVRRLRASKDANDCIIREVFRLSMLNGFETATNGMMDMMDNKTIVNIFEEDDWKFGLLLIEHDDTGDLLSQSVIERLLFIFDNQENEQEYYSKTFRGIVGSMITHL